MSEDERVVRRTFLEYRGTKVGAAATIVPAGYMGDGGTPTDDGVRFYVTAVEATATELAVLIPALLLLDDLPALRTRADQEGLLYTHVRTLAADEAVTFRHDDPEPFF